MKLIARITNRLLSVFGYNLIKKEQMQTLLFNSVGIIEEVKKIEALGFKIGVSA